MALRMDPAHGSLEGRPTVREVAAQPTGPWDLNVGGVHVVFGAGSIAGVGALARKGNAARVLLVTDPGVRAAGHVQRAEDSLRGASLQAFVFDGVEENPTTRHVEEGARFAREHGIDLIVGLGGGSAMDCAKAVNFLLTNGGRMEDYWGSNRAPRAMLPSIGIPTTAGTGSEIQSYALIEQEDSRRKMACGDEKARFQSAILDPELTVSLPRPVTARTGLDAVAHAVESYVTTRRNPISRMFAREAWALLESGFETVLDAPDDIAARSRMLLGSHLAGAAVEASMLGAAHACANPLTSRFGIPHGVAVLLTLPHVIRFNEAVAGPLYRELLRSAARGRRAASLADRVGALRDSGGLPGRLRDIPVPEDALRDLAKEAATQWTAAFNPRPVTEADLLEIYEAAY